MRGINHLGCFKYLAPGTGEVDLSFYFNRIYLCIFQDKPACFQVGFL